MEDISTEKVQIFLAKRNPAMQFNAQDIMTTLATLRVAIMEPEFKLKKAALLLFGKQPSQFIQQNQVKLVRFKGTVAVDILDTLTLSGTLIDNINQSLDFIQRHTRKTFTITEAQREEQPEYPFLALREAVVNAIVHRDYYSSAAVQINIYDNRLEITNPGALPAELKVDNLPFIGLGIPRNPTIYQLLHDAGYVEGLGTGFPRIYQSMQQAGLPDPKPEDLGTLFKITLYNANAPELRDGLSDRQRKALSYIREHKIISTSVYERLYNVSKPTAINDLNNLTVLGHLTKKGRGRATHYLLREKQLTTRHSK